MIIANALYAEIDRLTAQIKELTQSRDEWERLTLKAKAGFEGLLADYLDAARHIEQAKEASHD